MVLIGLANEYISYVTTPEEYDAQDYEGASTLYGPATGPLVQYYLTQLAGKLRPGASSQSPPYHFSYNAGPSHHFTTEDAGARPYIQDDGLSDILQSSPDGTPLRNLPHVEWDSPKIAFGKAYSVPTIPDVLIRTRSANGDWQPFLNSGVSEDNYGLDIVTVLLSTSKTSYHWCAIWMPPSRLPKQDFEFAVKKSNLVGEILKESPISLAK